MKTSALKLAVLFLVLATMGAVGTARASSNVLLWDNDNGRTLCDPDQEGCVLVGTEVALQNALAANGMTVTTVTELPQSVSDLDDYDAIWITLGWREGESPAGQISAGDEGNLRSYLHNCTCHSIFLQGNDFARDHIFSHLLQDFGAIYVADGDAEETGNLHELHGIAGQFTAGMLFPYEYQQGPDNFPDNIEPGGPTPGQVVLDDPRGMGFPTEEGNGAPQPGITPLASGGRGATIFLSVILSAFQDDGASTKNIFVHKALQYFHILAPGSAPVFEPPTPADGAAFTVVAGQSFIVNLQATDPDGDNVTIDVSNPPPNSGMSNVVIAPTGTGTFHWLPLASDVGDHTITFTATDGVNVATTSIQVHVNPPPPIVAFDIRPGGCPNPLSLKQQGMLPTAILGSATFDVHSIDISTVRLADVAPAKAGVEDVAAPYTGTDECGCTAAGPDGYADLTLKFPAQAIIAAIGAAADGEYRTLNLTGQYLDGSSFEGSDCVRIQKSAKWDVEIGTNSVTLTASPTPSASGVAGYQIGFTLPREADVTLTAYDVTGRLVDRVLSGRQTAGEHVMPWNTRRLSKGLYFLRLEAAGSVQVQRVVVTQ